MGHTKNGVHVQCPRCHWFSFRRKRFCGCEGAACACALGAGFGLCRCGEPMERVGQVLANRRAERARADLQRVCFGTTDV
jgi:hypothetical protein